MRQTTKQNSANAIAAASDWLGLRVLAEGDALSARPAMREVERRTLAYAVVPETHPNATLYRLPALLVLLECPH